MFGLTHKTHFTAFNISEVFKAGSLGHGTVVPGNYDIDLVIYSRGTVVHKLLEFSFLYEICSRISKEVYINEICSSI